MSQNKSPTRVIGSANVLQGLCDNRLVPCHEPARDGADGAGRVKLEQGLTWAWLQLTLSGCGTGLVCGALQQERWKLVGR